MTKEPQKKKNLSEVPRALSRLDEIGKAAFGKDMFVALDFDGTLAPINNDPKAVEISAEMKKRLKNLAMRCRVSILTGRDILDIKERVGLEELFYSGSHGFEISGPHESGIFFEAGSEYLPALDRAEESLRVSIGNIPGAVVDRKKFSISVHYRLVGEDLVPTLKNSVWDVARSIKGLRARPDKKAIEILPGMKWNKGSALLWLLKATGMSPENSFTISMGDDVTDEDTFRAIKGRGAGIIVTETEPPRSTFADYRLQSTAEAGRFIEILERIAGNTSQK
ncbi:MAG: trehalose-phosphatase [Thermovirgaceae bacterium]|nr:trehalose-phosphatase [Thermovirgaceae bacterium]